MTHEGTRKALEPTGYTVLVDDDAADMSTGELACAYVIAIGRQ